MSAYSCTSLSLKSLNSLSYTFLKLMTCLFSFGNGILSRTTTNEQSLHTHALTFGARDGCLVLDDVAMLASEQLK